MRHGVLVLLLLLLLTILSAVGQDCSDLLPTNQYFILTLLVDVCSTQCTRDNEAHQEKNVTLYVQMLVIENETTTINASVSYPDSVPEGSFMYYYKFKERTFGSSTNWTTIGCVQGNYTAGTVYQWEPNVPQARECVVELYSPDKVLLSKDTKVVRIAGPRDGLSVRLTTHQSSSKEFPCCYSIGEVTFTVRVTLPKDIKLPLEFLYMLSFGDGNKVPITTDNQELTIPHNYNDVCTTCVTEVFVIIKPVDYYYYCNTTQTTSVIEPVTVNNSHTSINNGKKLYKGHPVKLLITSNGTLPVTVCWHLWKMCNDFEENCTDSHSGSTNDTCITMTRYHSCGVKLPLESSGQFVLFAIFKNNASSCEISHNLTVGARTPVGVVAAGAAATSVVCIIIVVLLTSFFGYIQYQRYKNRHTETASFNFVILPPIDTRSCWARFKRSCRKKWYKLTGKRFHEGLVHTLSGSGKFSYSESLIASNLSYGTLLKSEKSQPDEDTQVVLHDYVDSQYLENEDNR